MKVWKIIPGTNGQYEVSNDGEIKRIKGRVANSKKGFRNVGGNVLSQKTKSNGYKEVNLYIDAQVSKMMYVHRAVASAFIGEIPAGKGVNHKDGNKANNSVDNLEIVSYSENTKHGIDNGLIKPPSFLGSKHGMAKTNEETVLEIRLLYSQGKTPTELSAMYKKPFSTICKICYRNTWKHI